jgi:Ca2+-binding RTX toxin-like protein
MRSRPGYLACLSGLSWDVRSVRLIFAATCLVTVLALPAAGATPVDCSAGGLCNGTSGDDLMQGTPGTDYLYAVGGNDIVRGRDSFDDLRGGTGNDDLDGGGGSDQYWITESAFGVDKISGDKGGSHDILIFQISAALTIDLRPGDGKEVTSGANSINIAEGVVIERVQAGGGIDTINGNGADNQLGGANLGDTIYGRGGDDVISGDYIELGNVGNDTLVGGPGNDEMYGGPGTDTIKALDSESDVIDCGDGTDTVFADAIDDVDIDCENVNP